MREKKIILEYQMSHLNTIFLDFFFFLHHDSYNFCAIF